MSKTKVNNSDDQSRVYYTHRGEIDPILIGWEGHHADAVVP